MGKVMPTFVAFVWPFASVLPFVALQASKIHKCLRTVIAFIRLLAGMCPFMYL